MAMKTTGSKKYLQLLLFQVALLGPVFCGKVLVWPTEGSHWLNMNVIIQELIHRGHSVTILVSNASLFIEPKAKAGEKFEVYNVPFTKDVPQSLINGIVALWVNNRPTILTFWQFYKELGRLSMGWQEMNKLMCNAVLANQELMAHLQGAGYDMVLSDPVTPCGELVAVKLDIPFVYSLRFSPAFTLERHCGKIPAPPSYTPATLSELTDHMSFGERIKNFVSYHLQDYVFQNYWGHWDIYYSKILGLEKDHSQISWCSNHCLHTPECCRTPEGPQAVVMCTVDEVYQLGSSQSSYCHYTHFHPRKDAPGRMGTAAKALHNNIRKTLCNREGWKPCK